MSSKISALPTAIGIDINDFITLINSGVNYQMQRDTFFQPSATDDAIFGIPPTTLGAQFGGTLFVAVGVAGNFRINLQFQPVMEVSPALGITIGYPGVNTRIYGPGPTECFRVDTTGNVSVDTANGTSVFVRYVAGTPGDWSGSAPIEMRLALDRLAAAVAGLLGGPIP